MLTSSTLVTHAERRPHGEALGLPALGGGARSGDLSIHHWRWAESDTR